MTVEVIVVCCELWPLDKINDFLPFFTMNVFDFLWFLYERRTTTHISSKLDNISNIKACHDLPCTRQAVCLTQCGCGGCSLSIALTHMLGYSTHHALGRRCHAFAPFPIFEYSSYYSCNASRHHRASYAMHLAIHVKQTHFKNLNIYDF